MKSIQSSDAGESESKTSTQKLFPQHELSDIMRDKVRNDKAIFQNRRCFKMLF